MSQLQRWHLSQFKEDTGGPYVPVREINLIAYLPLVQPTENSPPDLDLNPGHRMSLANNAQQVLWLRKRINPLSHGHRLLQQRNRSSKRGINLHKNYDDGDDDVSIIIHSKSLYCIYSGGSWSGFSLTSPQT